MDGRRTDRYGEKSDDELMAFVCEGRQEAFDTLLSRHRDALMTFLRRLTGNADDAEDVFQEAWVRVVERRDNYRPQGAFRGYIFKIAHNLALDLIRRRGIRKEISMDAPFRTDAGETSALSRRLGSDARDPLTEMEAAELAGKLTAAVEALPERLKEAFLLRRYGELSYEQVADSLGINISAAKMRVSRALDFIEEYLGEYLDVRRREARVSRRSGVVG